MSQYPAKVAYAMSAHPRLGSALIRESLAQFENRIKPSGADKAQYR